MSTQHFSPASGLPPFSQKTLNTLTWGANATALTIVDPYIVSNSQIDLQVTGSTPAAGRWSYTYSQGQVIVTSSDSEQSSLPLQYIIL